MDPLYQKAQRDVRHAAIVAFIAAAMIFMVTLIALTSEREGIYVAFEDPLNFVGVVVLVLFGLATQRYYRSAAIALLVYFILSKAFMAVVPDYLLGSLVSLVFLFFLARGIRGCFAYHRLRRRDDPSYRPAGGWAYFVAAPIGGLALLASGFGLLLDLGYLP